MVWNSWSVINYSVCILWTTCWVNCCYCACYCIETCKSLNSQFSRSCRSWIEYFSSGQPSYPFKLCGCRYLWFEYPYCLPAAYIKLLAHPFFPLSIPFCIIQLEIIKVITYFSVQVNLTKWWWFEWQSLGTNQHDKCIEYHYYYQSLSTLANLYTTLFTTVISIYSRNIYLFLFVAIPNYSTLNYPEPASQASTNHQASLAYDWSLGHG